ncbi:hypothetical protein [Amphritea sp. HPY]|uniref:hypothetical protein n=1 Tax=Amphritea sp. HPY TaxID=3421652 RepID=UPI003D7F072A
MQTFNRNSYRLLSSLLMVFLASTISIPADAGIRMADGQLISTGHSSTKLLHYLGKPISRSSSHGCLNRRCSKKGKIESWIYYYDNRTWTISISGGVIIDTKWTRRNR